MLLAGAGGGCPPHLQALPGAGPAAPPLQCCLSQLRLACSRDLPQAGCAWLQAQQHAASPAPRWLNASSSFEHCMHVVAVPAAGTVWPRSMVGRWPFWTHTTSPPRSTASSSWPPPSRSLQQACSRWGFGEL